MATQKDLNSIVLAEIESYKEKIKKSGILVESMILFGSQTKKTAKTGSDIDICVVSKEFGNDRQAERLRLMRLIDKNCIDIEPHPYHPQSLTDPWDPLAKEIRDYGILLKYT